MTKPVSEWKTYEDLPPTCMTLLELKTINKTGSWRAMRPVLDEEKCIKCLICWKFCPEPSIDLINDGADGIRFNLEYCKGCGICAHECPKGAITMVPEVEH